MGVSEANYQPQVGDTISRYGHQYKVLVVNADGMWLQGANWRTWIRSRPDDNWEPVEQPPDRPPLPPMPPLWRTVYPERLGYVAWNTADAAKNAEHGAIAAVRYTADPDSIVWADEQETPLQRSMSRTRNPTSRTWCAGCAGDCPEYGQWHGCHRTPKHPGEHRCVCDTTHPPTTRRHTTMNDQAEAGPT